MKILPIDQARNSAWVVPDYETKKFEIYGTLSFGDKDYTYARATFAIESLVDMIIKTYNISAVFIEDVQLRVNAQSFKKLAQFQGVLTNLSEKNGYLYDFIALTQWQSYCKTRGRSSKEIKNKVKALEVSGKRESKALSIQAAKEMYGIDTDNDNLAGAIMIGHFVINNYGIRSNQNDQIKTEKHEK